MKFSRFYLLILLTIMAALAFSSISMAQTNMITNPGFEQGWAGWFTFGDGPNLSTPSDDNISRTDTTAAKIFGEYNTCNYDVGGFGQVFTPTVGQVYSFHGYSYVSSNDTMPGLETCTSNRLVAQLAFFNAPAGGIVIAKNEVVVGDGNTVLDQWHEFSVSAPAPPGALRLEALFLFIQPACEDGSVFIDDVELYEMSPASDPNLLANPSFDTDLSGWTTFGTNVYHDGRVFAARTPTGSAKMFGSFVPGNDVGMFQGFSASEGSEWELDTYTLNTCEDLDPITGINDNYVVSKIVFRDAIGAEISAQEKVILNSSSPLGTWTKNTLVATAPAGTDSVDAMVIFIQPSMLGGAMFVDDVAFRQLPPTGISDSSPSLPFTLHQNVPNPFNPFTRIDFELQQADNVDISVYDVSGRRITTLYQGHLGSGPHHVNWNGQAANGTEAATGIYWYVLKTSMGQTSRKMMLMK